MPLHTPVLHTATVVVTVDASGCGRRKVGVESGPKVGAVERRGAVEDEDDGAVAAVGGCWCRRCLPE